MKCYNHTDREAVATCQRCGKALCKECASKYTPCLCDECFEAIKEDERRRALQARDARKNKYQDALIDTKTEYIKALLCGALISAALILVVEDGGGLSDMRDYVWVVGCCMCIPFGWSLLTYKSSTLVIIDTDTYLWAFVFKVVFSVILGAPAFLYQSYKVWSAAKKLSDLERN